MPFLFSAGIRKLTRYRAMVYLPAPPTPARGHGQTAPGRTKTPVSMLTQVSDRGSARDQAAALVEVEDCPDREAAIAWIVANQLGRRNLTPSQKAALAVEIEKQLAVEASKHRAATLKQNQATVVATVPQREQGRARELAAEMVGVSPRYVQDAKQIEQERAGDLRAGKAREAEHPRSPENARRPVRLRG